MAFSGQRLCSSLESFPAVHPGMDTAFPEAILSPHDLVEGFRSLLWTNRP